MKQQLPHPALARLTARRRGLAARIAFLICALACAGARAEPWLEVGDRGLRSDFELLVASGVLDGPETTWPIPAGQLSRLTDQSVLMNQPDFVQLAARRIVNRVSGEQPRGWSTEAAIRGTNNPDTVRDFGTLSRDKFGGEVGRIWDSDKFSAALRVSNEPQLDDHNNQAAFDGSYMSALLWNWQIYGGFVEQWYGPGWISSLTLSNNARPLPKIGIMRNNPHPFETPWLSWLGPWQFNTFVGVLNGPRIDANTILGALRFTFEPLHGLELGVTRLSQLCGRNHPCNPLSGEFHVQNTDANPSPVADQGTVDLKYTTRFGLTAVSPYLQMANRDNGPFTHSNTTYLVGATLAGPLRSDGAQWRITAEYTDTIATLNWFSFGKLDYGSAENDYKYVDGWRYRGRTLGFSLDSDSRLFSLAALVTTSGGWTYRLTYYRANVNSEQLAHVVPTVYPDQLYHPTVSYNSVSALPAQFDQVEAGVRIPWRALAFDLTVRAQDNQVYPEGGGKISGEAAVSYRF